MAKKILAAGLMALLVMGLVAAGSAAIGDGEKPGFLHGFGKDQIDPVELGLSVDASFEEIREALFQERLSRLGLSEDATVRELHDRVGEEMQERRSEMLEKLGLAEDASPEDIRTAMRSYCDENPDDCQERLHRGPGVMRGPPRETA